MSPPSYEDPEVRRRHRPLTARVLAGMAALITVGLLLGALRIALG